MGKQFSIYGCETDSQHGSNHEICSVDTGAHHLMEGLKALRTINGERKYYALHIVKNRKCEHGD